MKNCSLVILLLGLTGLPASGQGVKPDPPKCRQSLSLVEFLVPEDANAAKDAFRAFRSALLDGDKKKVVDHVRFPLDLVVDGYGLRFKDASELAGRYADIFTPYVLSSVRTQDPEHLVADWNGISLENGAVRFVWDNGGFLIDNVIPSPIKISKDVAEFLSKRPTCPPLVIEGSVVAYDWMSRMPAFENIYVDHLIVDVTRVLSGVPPQSRIRVDFWGVSHLPEYNLPSEALHVPQVWRMYLRPDVDPPKSSEVCGKDIQERVLFVDEETGREVESQSAIIPLGGEDGGTMTYVGLPCFEAKKQYFIKRAE